MSEMFSNFSSNANQLIIIIIYLFNFIEIKHFSQIFLKVMSQENLYFSMNASKRKDTLRKFSF